VGNPNDGLAHSIAQPDTYSDPNNNTNTNSSNNTASTKSNSHSDPNFFHFNVTEYAETNGDANADIKTYPSYCSCCYFRSCKSLSGS
jgi:hypothetical protein